MSVEYAGKKMVRGKRDDKIRGRQEELLGA